MIVALPKLGRLELQIMDALWTHGPCTVRDVQESLPAEGRPAYTTVLTVISRLEAKKAVRRVSKVSNAYIFETAISRRAAQKHLLDDFLHLFGGRMQPLMAQLIDAGQLTLEDVQEAEKLLRDQPPKDKAS